MKKLISSILAIAMLYLTPLQVNNVYAESSGGLTGKAVRVNRMSKEEAQSIIRSNISKIQKLKEFKGIMCEQEKIKKDLDKVISKCDNRESKYDANLVKARLAFGRDSHIEKGVLNNFNVFYESNALNYPFISICWKRYELCKLGSNLFRETFDLFEKIIDKYPKQEKKHGKVYKALLKMSEKSLEKKRVVRSAVCYGLAKHSQYDKKELNKLRGNLEKILNTKIGGVGLKEGMEKVFKPDYLTPEEITGYVWVEEKRAPLFKNKQKDSRLQSMTYIKEAAHEKKVGYFDLRLDGDINIEIYTGYPPKPTINLSISKNKTKDIFNGKNVVWKKPTKYFKEIFINKGVTIKEIFKVGGFDPYNWAYKDKKSLDNLDW
jgi:hypothetical protein